MTQVVSRKMAQWIKGLTAKQSDNLSSITEAHVKVEGENRPPEFLSDLYMYTTAYAHPHTGPS